MKITINKSAYSDLDWETPVNEIEADCVLIFNKKNENIECHMLNDKKLPYETIPSFMANSLRTLMKVMHEDMKIDIPTLGTLLQAIFMELKGAHLNELNELPEEVIQNIIEELKIIFPNLKKNHTIN